MSDKNYWRRRSLEYEKELSARCQSELETELAKYFKESLSEIEKDIAALYGRFARDNKLSYSDAKKLIRGAEFKEWRMSLQEYVALSHTNSKILKELNTLAMRSRISRLEKLYSDTLKELQNLGEKYDKVVGDFLKTAYTDRYTRGIHDLATVGKLEIPVAKVQPANLENVLAQRWAGGNYSTRIWKNTEHLSKVLKSTITQGLHRGLSVQKLSKSLSKEMGVSYKNAERLVRTELNFVSNMAARDSLIAAGLEEYEYIAAAGPRTCSICSNLNGTIHLLREFEVGTNAPPMHPRCRCTISAVVGKPKKERRANLDGGTASKVFGNSSSEKATASALLAKVNPNYSSGEYQWTHNCQRCIVAWEKLWRGENVTAKPFNPNDSIGNSGIAAWKFDNKIWWLDTEVKVTAAYLFKEEIQKAFARWGKNARVMVSVKWIDGDYHGFTARFSDGKIIHEDPQSARVLDIDEVLMKCSPKPFDLWFLRIDNREFATAVKDAVEYLED